MVRLASTKSRPVSRAAIFPRCPRSRPQGDMGFSRHLAVPLRTDASASAAFAPFLSTRIGIRASIQGMCLYLAGDWSRRHGLFPSIPVARNRVGAARNSGALPARLQSPWRMREGRSRMVRKAIPRPEYTRRHATRATTGAVQFRTVPVDSRGQPVGPGPSRPGDLLTPSRQR